MRQKLSASSVHKRFPPCVWGTEVRLPSDRGPRPDLLVETARFRRGRSVATNICCDARCLPSHTVSPIVHKSLAVRTLHVTRTDDALSVRYRWLSCFKVATTRLFVPPCSCHVPVAPLTHVPAPNRATCSNERLVTQRLRRRSHSYKDGLFSWSTSAP